MRVADVAKGRGIRRAVPDLTSVAKAAPPMWEHLVDLAVEAGRGVEPPIVVAGHSGAGVFLPVIADQLGAGEVSLIFVDAVVPPTTGSYRTSPEMRALVDSKAADGILMPWTDWWPADLFDEHVPDRADREHLRRDQPRVPAAFYDDAVPMPAGWSIGRCAYLQLSRAYAEDRREAGRRGWPTAIIAGNHLSPITDAERVLDAILQLVETAD